MTDGESMTDDEVAPRRFTMKTDKYGQKSKIPTKRQMETTTQQKSKIPVQKSGIPIRENNICVRENTSRNCNEMYSLTVHNRGNNDSSVNDSSIENISIIETDNEKHLSWDSGNNEEITSSWFNGDNNNNNINISRFNGNSNNTNSNNGSGKGIAASVEEIQNTNFLIDVNNSDSPDNKILSWHTLSIMTLQNMIIDQSEKIKQLEMNCHLQEILMKNQKDEIDLYQERIDQLEVQVKEDKEEKLYVVERMDNLEKIVNKCQTQAPPPQQHSEGSADQSLHTKVSTLECELNAHSADKVILAEKIYKLEECIDEHKEEMDLLLERIDDSMKTNGKEMDYLTERADNFEEFAQHHKQEKAIHAQRIETLEVYMKNLSHEAMELVSERIDNLVVAFEENKKEKELLLERIEEEIELFLERVANLEVALHNAEKTGIMTLDDRDAVMHTKEAISDLHTKVIDTYTDTEAALNVIHNMLHKDKLTKII